MIKNLVPRGGLEYSLLCETQGKHRNRPKLIQALGSLRAEIGEELPTELGGTR